MNAQNHIYFSLQVRELEEVAHERDALAVRLGMLEAKLDETRVERGQVGLYFDNV